MINRDFIRMVQNRPKKYLPLVRVPWREKQSGLKISRASIEKVDLFYYLFKSHS
jgi:hypothetical protein